MLRKKSYLISRAVGGLANSLFSMVFIWWLQVSTKSSLVVGVAEAIFSITAALSIFYGPIIDRNSFKKTSIYSMIIQTSLLFATTGIVYYLSRNYFIAIIFAGLVSICDEFFNPADQAILKETVTDDSELTNLISKISIIDQFVGVAGTALSGLLLTKLASANVMLICSCLSLLGAILLLFALSKLPTTKNKIIENKSNYYQQVFHGYQFIKRNKFLNHYLLSSILYSFVTPAMAILMPKIAQEFGKPLLYSAFYISFMLGFVVGAFITGKLKTKVSTIGIAWVCSAIPLILMLFFNTNWIIFSTLILLFGLITSIHNILSESMVQISSNDNILGRVLTTIRTSTAIGGSVGSVVAGVLLDHSGETVLIIGCFIIILLGGINILTVKNLY